MLKKILPLNKTVIHSIAPIYDENSNILILGSFPSVRSREENFFYGHKSNRFWKVISAVFEEAEPKSIDEKCLLLKKNGIALWDVIASCDITGSSDSSIKNVIPNDISPILKKADIKAIYVNGKTSEKYFNKYIKPICQTEAIYLPSTSPANAAYSLDKLINEWRIIKG